MGPSSPSLGSIPGGTGWRRSEPVGRPPRGRRLPWAWASTMAWRGEWAALAGGQRLGWGRVAITAHPPPGHQGSELPWEGPSPEPEAGGVAPLPWGREPNPLAGGGKMEGGQHGPQMCALGAWLQGRAGPAWGQNVAPEPVVSGPVCPCGRYPGTCLSPSLLSSLRGGDQSVG